MAILRQNLFRAWQLMGWRLRLLDKTVRKFAELPIYCQQQKCSQGNVVSGGIRFMQNIPGGSLERERQMRVAYLKMAIFASFVYCIPNILYRLHGHTTAFRWYDCQWPWAYFKFIGLFHIKFLKNGVWYGKSYERLLIGHHTIAFDWCHIWRPWSTLHLKVIAA